MWGRPAEKPLWRMTWWGFDESVQLPWEAQLFNLRLEKKWHKISNFTTYCLIMKFTFWSKDTYLLWKWFNWKIHLVSATISSRWGRKSTWKNDELIVKNCFMDANINFVQLIQFSIKLSAIFLEPLLTFKYKVWFLCTFSFQITFSMKFQNEIQILFHNGI